MTSDFRFITDIEKSLAGKVLLAFPTMYDIRFSRSAVLILEDKVKTGVTGVIINKPLDKSLHAFIKQDSQDIDYSILKECSMNLGGPVGASMLTVIHDSSYSHESSKRIKNGVFATGGKLVLDDILSSQKLPENAIYCAGYSCWSRDQLNKEMTLGSWMAIDVPKAALFNTTDLWAEVYRTKHLPWNAKSFVSHSQTIN